MSNDPGKLEMVIEVFRHGARGPLHEFYDGAQQKYMWGELTSVGMRQHYLLGKEMRKEFIDQRHFLDSNFDINQFEMHSSNVNRTIVSAYSHLNGMYPMGTGKKLNIQNKNYRQPPFSQLAEEMKINEDFALQAGFSSIPVHQIHWNDLVFAEICPLKDSLENEYNIQAENKKLYKYVWDTYGKHLAEKCSVIFKQKIQSLADLKDLQDNLFSDVFQNRQLPQELTTDLQEQLKFIYSFEWMFKNSSGKKNRVMSSELMKFISKNMERKILLKNESLSKKWISLSGHDSNIVHIMGALGLTSPQCLVDKHEGKQTSQQPCLDAPPYASQFLFELYSESQGKTYNVKVRYNGEYMQLQNFGTSLEFDKFRNIINEYTLENPWKHCNYKIVNKYATPEQVSAHNLQAKPEKTDSSSERGQNFPEIFIILSQGIIILLLVICWLKFSMDAGGLRPGLIKNRDDETNWFEIA